MTAPVVNTLFVPGTTITHEWLNGVNDYVNESNPADHLASNVTCTPTGSITATNVQDAIEQLNTYNEGSTGAVDRTIPSKLSDTVSVKDFGAVGDGVTDDTAAIQNAISENYGKTLYFPQGNYLISSALNVTEPIILDADPGCYLAAGTYGARIFTNTAGINLVDIHYTGASNGTGGGGINNLYLDGNSKASIGLNVYGSETTNINFYGLNVQFCTHLGVYLNSGHSFRFFGCQFSINGITSSTVNDGGIQIDETNCVNFFGCNSEANKGCGVIMSGGYNNCWDGGTIEGNDYHGVYALLLAINCSIVNVDFEANNALNNANIYDINLSAQNNSYFNISDCQFAINANITTRIFNNGTGNFFYNNRAYNGYTIEYGGNAAGGLCLGYPGNKFYSGFPPPYASFINTYPVGFNYSTPSLPASGVDSDPVTANYRIYFTSITGITSIVVFDSSGTGVTLNGPFSAGFTVDLQYGWKIRVSYTGSPTWKWAQI